MGGLSIWHWIVVLVVVLLLFGRGKISELMGDAAKGIKAFKKGMSEDEETAAADPKAPPKTIDHQASQPSQVRTESEKKVG
jgi:sec-independent protein translocase protein TatA